MCFAFTAYPLISLFAEELKKECKEIGEKDDCGIIRDVRSQSVTVGEIPDRNFLDAGFHVGVDTVGQTLRDADRQLRSEPANPLEKLNALTTSGGTIEPDIDR